MRDVFYTILVVWIIWRIFNSISSYTSKQSNSTPKSVFREGETTVKHTPNVKKKIGDELGEYVDYEEIK